MTKIEFRTESYEGPLDLLLALIQKAEVNIYDIPIASITHQFLEYIDQANKLGLSDLSDFYLMAAELIWIKSQMLLPVDLEYDGEYEDPRQELVEKLLEHQKFLKYSKALEDSMNSDILNISRNDSNYRIPFSDEELWNNITINDLMKAYTDAIKSYEKVTHKIFNIFEKVTVKEKVILMSEIFERKDSFYFSELLEYGNTTLHIICSFLAVLDTVKNGFIYIERTELFEDFLIIKKQVGQNE